MIKHVEIINKQKRMLRGYLNLPSQANELVVMLHGYTGNKTEHNGIFRTLSRELEKINIASLRMDYSCNGESDGEFNEFSYLEALDDVKLIIDYASSCPAIKHLSLLGFSMGGAIAALVCNYYPFEKLLLWSPAGSLYEKLKERWENTPKMSNGNIYSAGFELGQKLVDSMAGLDYYQECSHFTKPVLLIHGRNDKAVDYLTGVTYAVKFPNSLLHIVNTAGHGYDDEISHQELLSLSLTFLQHGFEKIK